MEAEGPASHPGTNRTIQRLTTLQTPDLQPLTTPAAAAGLSAAAGGHHAGADRSAAAEKTNIEL